MLGVIHCEYVDDINLISPESRFNRLHMPISTVLDVVRYEIWQKSLTIVKVTLRGFKLIRSHRIWNGIMRLPILVVNSNLGRISHDFGATTSSGWKAHQITDCALPNVTTVKSTELHQRSRYEVSACISYLRRLLILHSACRRSGVNVSW